MDKKITTIMKKIFHWALAALCATTMGCGQQAQPTDSVSDSVTVTFTTTEGDITVWLYDDTPLHRDNFIEQAQSGFFDSLLFHRVIKDFMIQSGDPTSKHAAPGVFIGDESPEKTVAAEFLYPRHFHKQGALAAARESDDVNPRKESSSHQFYIVCGKTYPSDSLLNRADSVMYARSGMHMDAAARNYYREHPGTPQLDGSYTVFGEVVEGMDVVNRIQLSATDTNDRPEKDIRIIRVEVSKR